MALLEVRGLSKSYKTKKVLSNISMNLEPGEIIGLVGANGSGKTTLFKIILGLVNKEKGDILIDGIAIESLGKSYLNHIGTIIEYPTFYDYLTAFANISLLANLYEQSKGEHQGLDRLFDLVGLSDDKQTKVSDYSLGMRQRLGLVQALSHNPRILLLDEPFNGLDPQGVKDLRQLLKSLAQQGIGIIVSSHSLDELNKFIDSVILIRQGKIIYQGSKATFLELGHKDTCWLLATDQLEQTKSILEQLKISYEFRNDIFELNFNSSDIENLSNQLLQTLFEHQISIKQFSEQNKNFEDIFLELSNGEGGVL